MDDKKINSAEDSESDDKNAPNMPSVPGVYPAQHKMTAEEVAEQDAKHERERIKTQWEAQKAQNKQDERKQAEEERQRLDRERLYKDLESFDYELLSLQDYPSDFEIESARRARMAWFFGLGIAVFLFTSSLLNLIHTWIGGIAGGIAFVLWLSHGTGMLTILPGLSSHPELLARRRRIKNQVTEYIQHIEGKRGYIHRIYPLVHHNPRLRARKFRRIALMSKEHTIISNMKTLQDVALFNEYLEEAKKGAQEYFLKQAEDKLLEDEGIDPDVENLDADLADNDDDSENEEETQAKQQSQEENDTASIPEAEAKTKTVSNLRSSAKNHLKQEPSSDDHQST
jgi:hypothetical protein